MGKYLSRKKKKLVERKRKFLAYVLHDEVSETVVRYDNELECDRMLYFLIRTYDEQVFKENLPPYYRCFVTKDYILV